MKLYFFLTCIIFSSLAYAQKKKTDDYLLLVTKKAPPGQGYGYKNKAGKMIIPYNKYPMAFTDTFRTYAIVLVSKEGLVGIDRNQKILFKVFPFDNGPDEISDGLFRIIENGRIGYADASGKVVIKPKYNCAYPFENGRAKVSLNCSVKKEGEHSTWESDEWIYINNKGVKVNKLIL